MDRHTLDTDCLLTESVQEETRELLSHSRLIQSWLIKNIIATVSLKVERKKPSLIDYSVDPRTRLEMDLDRCSALSEDISLHAVVVTVLLAQSCTPLIRKSSEPKANNGRRRDKNNCDWSKSHYRKVSDRGWILHLHRCCLVSADVLMTHGLTSIDAWRVPSGWRDHISFQWNATCLVILLFFRASRGREKTTLM